MAYPTDPSKGYSFTDFALGQGDNSFPGTQMDSELQKLFASDTAIINFIEASALRSDGGIKAGTVDYSALGNSVLQYISETLGYLGPFDGTIELDVSMNGYRLLGLAPGSSGAPGIAFDGYADYGLYISPGGATAIAAAGQPTMQFWSTYVRPVLPMRASTGTGAAPAYGFFDDVDVGMDYIATGRTLVFYTDGAERVSFNSSRTSFASRLFAPLGTATDPAYTFTSFGGHGAYYYTGESGGIGFATNNTLRARITTDGGLVADANITGQRVLASASNGGTAAAPGFSFPVDLDTGAYRSGENGYAISAGGTRIVLINGDGLTVDFDLEVSGAANVDGLLTALDITITDDLTVGDAATIGGILTVTGDARLRADVLMGSGSIDGDTQVMINAASAVSGDFAFKVKNSTAVDFGVLGDGRLRADRLSTATGTALVITGSDIIAIDSSSRRYKEDLKPYERGLEDLMKLRPTLYQMKSERGPWHAGLIAEEVLEAGFPEFVTHNRFGQVEGIREAKMSVSLVVNAVQELARRVETLEARA